MSRIQRLKAFMDAARTALEAGENPAVLRETLEAEIGAYAAVQDAREARKPARYDLPGHGE